MRNDHTGRLNCIVRDRKQGNCEVGNVDRLTVFEWPGCLVTDQSWNGAYRTWSRVDWNTVAAGESKRASCMVAMLVGQYDSVYVFHLYAFEVKILLERGKRNATVHQYGRGFGSEEDRVA